jgi:hypothetical protein
MTLRERLEGHLAKVQEKQFRMESRILRITVDATSVHTKNGGGPLAGAQARLESSGDIERRITATRLVLTGPLALAWRKRRDHRSFWLTITGTGFEALVEVGPQHEDVARRWVAAFNTLAMNASE